MKKFLILSFSFAFCILNIKLGWAATWLDPALKWKTIETPHFLIHYHQGIEETAKKMAVIAEETHDKLAPIFNHEPELKTNVALLDTVDYGNGFTTVFPDPRITIYLTDWATNLNPSKEELWLKFVFIHEYSHVLHLDIAEGIPLILRVIMGRVIMPNALMPAFFIEGYPTYMETKYGQGGRGHDPRWDMMMRMDVLENNVKLIDQASVKTVRWPMGNLSYLYGVEFLQYLSEKYGEDKLIMLAHVYGNFLVTIDIDTVFLYLYDKRLIRLWNDWLIYSRDKYERQRESLGKLTRPDPVTKTGYYNLKPRWHKDSTHIFYQQRNADLYPNIRMTAAGSGEGKKIFEGSVFADSMSLDPAGGELLFSKSDTYRNYYYFKDLYLYDLQTGKARPLTEGGRFGNAVFSPDGLKIVCVQNEKGTNRLAILGRDGKFIKYLCSYEANAQYFSPSFSPDAGRIAVAKWSLGGEQKIYLVDAESGRPERITFANDLTSEANPVFSPAGDYIFFDSDRTGIVNIYAYALKTGKLYQVTNVIGGAMMPDVSPDGKKLAYVSYSSHGYDIAVAEIDTGQWVDVRDAVAVAPSETSSVMSNASKVSSYEVHDYQPWGMLIPKYWLPFKYMNENGPRMYLSTSGSDILSQHNYFLRFGYDFEVGRPQYTFTYNNNQLLPQISLELDEQSVSYGWNGSQTVWLKQNYEALYFSFYDNRVFHEWDRQILAAGFEQTIMDSISGTASLTTQPSLGNVNGVFVAWSYLNSRRYPKSISPEDGYDLTLRLTTNTTFLGSDYSYSSISSVLSSYFPAFIEHHVFSPRLYGFYSRGDQLAQGNFSWRYLPIRGYSSTDLRGNKGLLLSAEYRFPIVLIERTILYGAAFFDRLWASAFFDVGGATFSSISNLKMKRSVGLEVNFNTLIAGYFEVMLKLAYAKGLDENAQDGFYTSITL